MSGTLVTVEQAAQYLHLHPKTVLRYIREGRLPATLVGKSYRIARATLDEFGGGANAPVAAPSVRATCIVDIPNVSVHTAERLATYLQCAAMSSRADTPPLHLQTAFAPDDKSMKVVMIASPAIVASLLEMLQAQLDNLL